jgi:hypothetical protein
MTPELKKQCETILGIINTQTDNDKDIGDQYILRIFNNLKDSEKIFILKCISECSDCLEKKDLYNSINTDTASKKNITKKVVKQEIDNIDDYNTKELIRLKIWGVKVFVLIGLLIGSIIILSMIILGAGAVHTTSRFINEVETIIGYLTN